ncbi:AEC family transporter [Pelosinus fermentans]|uniref:Auxin Efflux Carrier n=1 Tax=Pelosinus fermentans JBW45 TaxID=1192197 RepID=I9NPN7_9FIRM|nr:AEC family transporter [Pelosinus fermentans]AJQ28581.1 Auxin Efflux Carrier [Pelosinus fermentans JBW45]
MDIKLKLVYVFMDLLLPLMLGYFFRRRQYLSEKNCDKLIVVNILVISTALSILSFWALPLKWELIWLPFFGILLSIIPGTAAYFASKHKYTNCLEKGSYLASAILSNSGTLGGLCAYIIFGEAAFAYTQIVGLAQNLVLFLFCFPMAQYYRQQSCSGIEKQKITFASMFLNRNQLPVVGLIIGIILCVSGVPRPAFFGAVFDPLVHIAAWTALIPAGYSINFSGMKEYYSSTFDLVPIKLVITPIIGYLLAREVFNDQALLGTILILASVPTGINAIVTARLYGLNLHVSGAAFVLTTAVFLVLVYPILFFWITTSSLVH